MTESQKFPEVFPDFIIPDNLSYVLSSMTVEKVVMKQAERSLVVYLRGEHILGKKLINKIAYDLKKQLFGKASLFLEIDDRYDLSPLYTLEQLTKDYWDSILYEVRKMGQVEYSLMSVSYTHLRAHET